MWKNTFFPNVYIKVVYVPKVVMSALAFDTWQRYHDNRLHRQWHLGHVQMKVVSDRPLVHTKQAFPLTETATFWNQVPDWTNVKTCMYPSVWPDCNFSKMMMSQPHLCILSLSPRCHCVHMLHVFFSARCRALPCLVQAWIWMTSFSVGWCWCRYFVTGLWTLFWKRWDWKSCGFLWTWP